MAKKLPGGVIRIGIANPIDNSRGSSHAHIGGDQRIFVSNPSKAERDFGWRPNVGVQEGVSKLTDWVLANRELFAESRPRE